MQTDTDTMREIFEIDLRRYSAMVAGDAQQLDALLSADLDYTHSDGRTDSKTSYLESIRVGKLRYHRCERETAIGNCYGDVAILHGTVCLFALDQGMEKAIRIHYLANWIRNPESGWQLRAWGSTLIERLT